MEWTGLNELREKFLSFFESKGHLRLPSFPLIPQNDKSLLLINSGMAPMKRWFTGEETPPSGRVTTCQKCIRTPDIENVGKTARHATYFEMLGNFSFGDYFKDEVIPWAWEFCTETLRLDPGRLYVSVYEDDDEAYRIWREKVGVPPERIVRFGREDNFWEHGAGPCGPCSELYFDRGEKYGCGRPDCKVGCECDRYIEFWNLVFTQLDSDGCGNYLPLSHPNIDTGMGLERLACIMQDADSLFEVDTIQNIMKHIMRLSGAEYHKDAKTDVSLRVITDHLRSTTMMVGDGILPSNEGRGYVLRRLLRRAARHGRLLGIEGPFLHEAAQTVIDENKTAYPGLTEKRDFILGAIRAEEESFARTLDAGLAILEEKVAGSVSGVLSGEDAFLLSDTYGFPFDLTRDILEEKGLSVDEKRYAVLLQEAKKKARAAHKDAGAEAWRSSGGAAGVLPKTEFVGYESLTAGAEVLEVLSEDGKTVLVLDRTPFYAESGGQAGDVGTICGDGFVFTVENTAKTPENVFLHHGSLSEGCVRAGAAVECAVDRETREAAARNHTAAHLLQAALRKTLGAHVEQAGQLVTARALRFDFTHFSALTAEQIRKVEFLVNSWILQAAEVRTDEMPLAEAKKLGATALFGEKYGEIVRVVRAGDFSAELCGGTHVKSTGCIGLFKILSESSVASGVRRIEAVTGLNVMRRMEEREALIAEAARNLKLNDPHELPHRSAALAAELKEKEREIASLRSELAARKTEDLMKDALSLGSVRLIAANAGTGTPDALRSLCDRAGGSGEDVVALFAGVDHQKGTAVFACRAGRLAVEAGVHAGRLVRAVAGLAGGSGGGRPGSAMAGAKDAARIDDAINGTAEIVKAMLK